MMLRFKNLKILGFGSIINQINISFDKSGLRIIKGKNGSGKTTTYNALTWVLFGEKLKEKSSIEPWDIVKDRYQGTCVSISFDSPNGKEYIAVRTLNYKEVKEWKGKHNWFLYEEGELLPLKDKAAVKLKIAEVTGFTFRLFRNSIVFGQKMKRIIEATGPEQKKVFEEAFSSTFIEAAKKKVDSKLKRVDDDLSQQSYQLNNKRDMIGFIRQGIIDAKESITVFEENKTESLKQFDEDIEGVKVEMEIAEANKRNCDRLKGRLATYEKKLSLLNKLAEKKKVLDGELFKKGLVKESIGAEVQSLQNKIGTKIRLFTSVPKDCPRCLRAFDKLQVTKEKEKLSKESKELKREKKDKENSVLKITTELNAIKDETGKLEKRLKNRENFIQRIAEAKVKIGITQSEEGIKNHQHELSLLLAKKHKLEESTPPTTGLDKLKEQLSRVRKQRIELTKVVNALEKERQDYRWLVNDPLSNSGLKAYIFSNMLQKVNSELTKYETVLGFNIEFGIDMESARKDFFILVQRAKQVIDYFDLSGGEGQLINVCIAFSIHDTITQNNDCNILIMDEVFESLDADNIDIISELILLKSQDKCVDLITHRDDFNPTNSRYIYYTKKDDITSITQ